VSNPKFKLWKSERDNQYYFRLQAENGEPILHGEGYKFKDGAENGIESVKIHAPFEQNYERKTSRNGEYYFTLRAYNYEVIGMSEMYDTKQGCENGIDAVKRTAPKALVVNLNN
jgi:uncharacterized protein YegP (UPF0339 family)